MTTSVILDKDRNRRVRGLAEVRNCSAHWIMREAIRDYVEPEDKRYF